MAIPPTIECPKCGAPATEIAEEADIGVGVQRFVLGIDCPHCGQIALCPWCGVVEGEPHRKYCDAPTAR